MGSALCTALKNEATVQLLELNAMEKKSIAVVFLVVVLGICHGGIALAAESRWHKYENSHFIAYSDNSEPPVRRLLKELEYFRAAVIQFANIEVPPDTPKTHLVVF